MIKAFAKATLAGIVAGASLAAAFLAGQHSIDTNKSCTFDGGGTIQSGEIATVTTGQSFICQDGTLIKIWW